MNEARKIRAREIGAPLRRPRGNMEAGHRKLKLMVYDLGVLAFVAVMILRVFPRGNVTLSWGEAGLQFLLAAVCVMVSRERIQGVLPSVALQPDQQLPPPFDRGCGGGA